MLVASGCASIVSENKTRIETVPVSAECRLVGTSYDVTITTPVEMELPKRAAPITATCEAPGYDRAVQVLDTEFNGAVAGNVLLGGIIGVVIDVANDNHRTYPSEFIIDMPQLGAGGTAAPRIQNNIPAGPNAPIAVAKSRAEPDVLPAQLRAIQKKWNKVEQLIKDTCEKNQCAAELAELRNLRNAEIAKLVEEEAKPGKQTSTKATVPQPDSAAAQPSTLKTQSPIEPKFQPVSFAAPAIGAVIQYSDKKWEVTDVDGFVADIEVNNRDYLRTYANIFEFGDNVLSLNSDFEVDSAGTDMALSLDSSARAALSGLWPLAPGKLAQFTAREVSHGGAVSKGVDEEWRFKVQVMGEQFVEARGESLRTIVLISTGRSKLGRVFERYQWYSPKLRAVIKSTRRWSGKLVDHALPGMKAGDREASELVEALNTGGAAER